MHVLKAIGVTASIVAILILIAAVISQAALARTFIVLILLGSSIWASLDSIKLKRYRTGLPGPVVLFIGFVVMWIVYFPSYLAKRYAVQDGRIPLKKVYRPTAEASERSERHLRVRPT